MPAPSTAEEFLELVQKSGVLDDKRLSTYLEKLRATGAVPTATGRLAGVMVRDGILTHFQAEQFLQGRWRRFTIGKYKVLERIASGGMGSVYLCEHKFMRRRAAVKILPEARASDPSALERFYREARAVAALDHPNIVRAYDIDQENNLHFLVMEYVDGSSLQDLVKKSGPLDPARAAHYISQAALGLQHAHEAAALVHRDIKPGNLIVDRGGIVKILDMGLARFFNDQDDMLTQKYDENVLGTADYLAPEQALDSHNVDIRADVYSLGATFYYCLTGKTPFSDGTVAQKLIWHQTRQPKPIRSLRQDIPAALIAVIEKMMAKDPDLRYQTPLDVAQALAPWTQATIAPPAETEMPQLSPAVQAMTGDFNFGPRSPTPTRATGNKPAKSWQLPENGSSNPMPPQTPAVPERGKALVKDVAARPEPARAEEAVPPTMVAPATPALPADEDTGFVVAATAEGARKVEEESIPWENLSDTKDQIAHTDTAASAKKQSSLKLRGSKSAVSAADRRRLWWVIGIVSGVALLLLAILFWLAFLSDAPKTIYPDQQQPAVAARLLVSRAGPPNAFRSVQEAAARAGPGAHIVLQDAVLEEQTILKNKHNLFIESAPGGSVIWRGPAKGDAAKQILYVENCENLVLQGITFDGGGKVDEALFLFGNCPGLSVKDVEIAGFKKYGMVLSNCAGKPGREVLIQHVHTATGDADAAIAFSLIDKVTPKLNQYISIRSCRFEGNYKKPVLLDPDGKVLDNLTWDDNTLKSKNDAAAKLLPPPK